MNKKEVLGILDLLNKLLESDEQELSKRNRELVKEAIAKIEGGNLKIEELIMYVVKVGQLMTALKDLPFDAW